MSDGTNPEKDTRCVILRHATDLFAHYGYGKTNIGDIAKRCCMSPGNLYRYFRNKQAIGEEVVRDYMAESEAKMSAVVGDSALDYETRVRRFYHCGVDDLIAELEENPKLLELAQMIVEGNSGILARHVEWKRAQVVAMLQEGVEAGEIEGDPAQIAFTLYDMTKAFLAPPLLAQMDFTTVSERLDAVLDLAFAGMRKR